MSDRDRIIYGAVMAVAVFFIGQFVLAVGSFLVNVFFAIAMGAFAFFAVGVAAKIGGKGKR